MFVRPSGMIFSCEIHLSLENEAFEQKVELEKGEDLQSARMSILLRMIQPKRLGPASLFGVSRNLCVQACLRTKPSGNYVETYE